MPKGNGRQAQRSGPNHTSDDDAIELKPNGTIILTVGGYRHKLGRPTTGTLREWADTVNDLMDRDREHRAVVAERQQAWDARLTELGPGVKDADVVEAIGRRPVYSSAEPWEGAEHSLDHETFDWWREVVTELCKDGSGLSDDDDDMPPWLNQGPLLSEVFKAWRTVPWVGGASPSDQEAAAQLDQLKNLGPDALGQVMSVAGPLLAAQLNNGNGTSNANVRR